METQTVCTTTCRHMRGRLSRRIRAWGQGPPRQLHPSTKVRTQARSTQGFRACQSHKRGDLREAGSSHLGYRGRSAFSASLFETTVRLGTSCFAVLTICAFTWWSWEITFFITPLHQRSCVHQPDATNRIQHCYKGCTVSGKSLTALAVWNQLCAPARRSESDSTFLQWWHGFWEFADSIGGVDSVCLHGLGCNALSNLPLSKRAPLFELEERPVASHSDMSMSVPPLPLLFFIPPLHFG